MPLALNRALALWKFLDGQCLRSYHYACCFQVGKDTLAYLTAKRAPRFNIDRKINPNAIQFARQAAHTLWVLEG